MLTATWFPHSDIYYIRPRRVSSWTSDLNLELLAPSILYAFLNINLVSISVVLIVSSHIIRLVFLVPFWTQLPLSAPWSLLSALQSLISPFTSLNLFLSCLSHILYHFNHKFTRCYALWVNLLSSLVHEPKLLLQEIFKFMYKIFEQLIKPLWVCNLAQQTVYACFC